MSARPYFEAQSVGLRYGTNAALADVTLAVARGGITALVGPSGCGKTSFLTCLNRLCDLVPRTATEGRVLRDGEDVRAAGVDLLELRRKVGMIFQRPSPFPTSVRRNFALPLRNHGRGGRDEIEAAMNAALEAVGLWAEVKDRLDGSARALSGGQQQRLCIARALALRPEALLFDEPCSALDPLSSGVVEELIASLRGRYSIVIVTHNLAQARRIADDVAFFWAEGGVGRLVEAGPAAQLFEGPRDPLTSAFLSGRRG